MKDARNEALGTCKAWEHVEHKARVAREHEEYDSREAQQQVEHEAREA